MQYTGSYCLVAGSDGIIHTSIEEAVETRDDEKVYYGPDDQEN